MKLTGECFCGEIKYEISGEIFDVRSCHCSRCRKAFSSQASAYALVNPSEFSWISGKEYLNTYASQQGFGLQFCKQCGSTLCGIYENEVHGVTLGCLNEDPKIEIGRHIFVGSKASWEVIPEGVTQYHENAPKNAQQGAATENLLAGAHKFSQSAAIYSKTMNDIYPCIRVCDIETSIGWYEHFLGFICTFKSSIKNPEFATIENNGFKIYMASDSTNKSYASNIIVIETDDINASLQTVEDAGAIMYQSIGHGFFGATEFIIKDYEDNKIIFRQKG